jgi:hypothetical protein
LNGSQIFPPFSPSNFTYVIVSMQDFASISPILSANLSCIATYQGQVYTTCDIGTIPFAVAQAPSPLTITLFVATDATPLNVTYTFQLRKIGCYASNLIVQGTNSLTNCSSVSGAYPAAVTCISSQTAQTKLQFSAYRACPLQVMYVTNGQPSSQCGNNITASNVAVSCAAASGLTQLVVIAQDPDVTTYTGTIATISFTNGLLMDRWMDIWMDIWMDG